MRTVILGKEIENTYDIDCKKKEIKNENGESSMVFYGKPELIKEEKISWQEICSFEGEVHYNSNKIFSLVNELNISEEETVIVENEIFRADLNEMHLKTNKVISEIDVNKLETEMRLKSCVEEFNHSMILSNEKLKSYCDIHNLSFFETDAIELFKLIYPNKEYEIVDGVMKVKKKSVEMYISSADINASNIAYSVVTPSYCKGNVTFNG